MSSLAARRRASFFIGQALRRALPWPLALVLVVAAANVIVSFCVGGAASTPDSPTYESAVDRILNHGYDTFRSPLYPLCMSLCYKLMPGHWHELLAVLQIAAFLVAVALLWHVAAGLSRSRVLASVVTLFYALVPGGPSTYATALIADSLFFSAIAAVIFAAWQLWTSGRCAWLYLVALTAVGMLKPAFTAFLPAAAVFLIGMFVRRKAKALMALLLTLCSLAPVVFQTYHVNKEIRLMSPSVVTQYNRYLIAFYHAPRLTPLAKNPELKAYLDSAESAPYREPYLECYIIVKRFGGDACDSLTRAAGAPWVGVETRAKMAVTDYRAFFNPVDSPEGHNAYVRFVGCSTPLGWLPWALWPLGLLAGAWVVVRAWRARRECPWSLIALWLMAAAFVFGPVLYAPYAFDRLAQPALAPLLLLIIIRRP